VAKTCRFAPSTALPGATALRGCRRDCRRSGRFASHSCAARRRPQPAPHRVSLRLQLAAEAHEDRVQCPRPCAVAVLQRFCPRLTNCDAPLRPAAASLLATTSSGHSYTFAAAKLLPLTLQSRPQFCHRRASLYLSRGQLCAFSVLPSPAAALRWLRLPTSRADEQSPPPSLVLLSCVQDQRLRRYRAHLQPLQGPSRPHPRIQYIPAGRVRRGSVDDVSQTRRGRVFVCLCNRQRGCLPVC